MFNAEICFFSPLCIKTVQEGHHAALLLQFILTELFCLHQEFKTSTTFANRPQTYFFPYDWSSKIGSLIKIQEQAQLLPYAFPKLLQNVVAFDKNLKTMLNKIDKIKISNKPLTKKQFSVYLKNVFQSLEPFLIACNENENLLLFLLKNKQNIIEFFLPETFETILKRINLDLLNMINIIQEGYQKRGFHFNISETTLLSAS